MGGVGISAGRLRDGRSSAGRTAAPPRYVPDELVVRFTPGTAADQRRSLNAGQGATEKQRLLVPRAYLLRLSQGRDVPAAARAYERNPNVEFAHPNYIAEPVSTTPNDPSFSSLWGLHNTGQTVNGVIGTPDADIDAPEAWDITQGSTAVTVGVADTGIAYNHPDLAANIWANPGESGSGKETNGVDDDGNGRVDDFRGYDFVSGDNDPMDDNGHGSHVAGTIGAVGNNGTGITGVNWQVRLAPLRICSPDPFVLCTSAAQADAFAYAGQKGMKVVNASISGSRSAQIVATAIAGAPGTLFVFAAGNENNNNDTNPQYPCGYPSSNVVCVAASDEDDNRATFSNYGASAVDLAAPGTSILSTYPFPVRFERRLPGRKLLFALDDGRHAQRLGTPVRRRRVHHGRQPRQLPEQHELLVPHGIVLQPQRDVGLPGAVPPVARHRAGLRRDHRGGLDQRLDLDARSRPGPATAAAGSGRTRTCRPSTASRTSTCATASCRTARRRATAHTSTMSPCAACARRTSATSTPSCRAPRWPRRT